MKQLVENIKLKESKEYLESHGVECCDFDAFIVSLGIECDEVIPPINSTAYCVRRVDKQWAAFEFGNKTPIVDFGKYNHMWGFDNGYCLVSVVDKDKTTFANRGIINEQGEEVVRPYSFQNIFGFYGRVEPFITVFVGNEIKKLNKSFLELL